MNTTLLFVEIFISGVQGLVWAALLALNLAGYQWLTNAKLPDFGGWSFLVSALIFSFAYSLGIVVDRTANALYSNWDKKIGARYFPSKDSVLKAVRFQVENENLNKALEYIRTRLRIARASSINFLLIMIFSIGLISKLDFLSSMEKWKYGGIVAVIGLLFVIAFVGSWYSLTKANYRLVLENTPDARKSKPATKQKRA